MLSSSLLIISFTLFALLGVTRARAGDGGIAWQGWSETAFAQAKRENRFVLLDLGAAPRSMPAPARSTARPCARPASTAGSSGGPG